MALLNISFSLRSAPDIRLAFILIALWGAVCGMGLSHAWRHTVRRQRLLSGDHGLPRLRLALGILVLTVLQVTLVALAFRFMPGNRPMDDLGWLPPALAFWAFMYLTWTVFYGAVLAARRNQHLALEQLRLQLQVKDAELRALRAQANPHFFFNSLNSIRALMFQDVPAAAGASGSRSRG